jgi:hypothetical protein
MGRQFRSPSRRRFEPQVFTALGREAKKDHIASDLAVGPRARKVW